MRTRELAEIAPRSADHAEDLAVEANFEDAARVGRLAHEQYLIAAGSDANRVGRSHYPLETFAGRCNTIGSARRGIRRHIDREHALEIAVGIKDLDAMIRAVANIDIILDVDSDRVRQVELARAGALRSP